MSLEGKSFIGEDFGERIEGTPLRTIAAVRDRHGACSFGYASVGQHIGGLSSIFTASR